MAFQIKDFASIGASMMNWVRATSQKVTDFNVGSIVRTLLEAVAIEIEELYRQMFNGLKESIPVAVYNSFDFPLLPARPASGSVRVSIAAQTGTTLVAAGTIFSLDGNAATYTSTADVLIPPGGTFADVPVVAVLSGASGNLATGKTFKLAPAIQPMVSAFNLVGMVGGVDVETEAERKMRFRAYIAALNHGTPAALEYGLKTVIRRDALLNEIERVRLVRVYEPWMFDNNQPVGYVRCFIHNGVGGSSELLRALAAKVLMGYVGDDGIKVAGWQSAGVQVDTLIAAEVPVPVVGVLTALPGFVAEDLRAEARQVIYAYLLSLPIDTPAIRSEIVAKVMEIDGVYDFIPSAPAANVPALVTGTGQAVGVKLMPGTLTIT